MIFSHPPLILLQSELQVCQFQVAIPQIMSFSSWYSVSEVALRLLLCYCNPGQSFNNNLIQRWCHHLVTDSVAPRLHRWHQYPDVRVYCTPLHNPQQIQNQTKTDATFYRRNVYSVQWITKSLVRRKQAWRSKCTCTCCKEINSWLNQELKFKG